MDYSTKEGAAILAEKMREFYRRERQPVEVQVVPVQVCDPAGKLPSTIYSAQVVGRMGVPR